VNRFYHLPIFLCASVCLWFSFSVAQSYPVTIENCDFTQTYEEAPSRIVGVSPTLTETLIALGAGDNIIATGYSRPVLLPEYTASYEAIPTKWEAYPAKEVLLAAEPDFIYGAVSFFNPEVAGTRQDLEALGSKTYNWSEDCQTGSVTAELAYQKLRDLGSILGVSEGAETLIGEMQQQIADVETKLREVETKPRVFLYDSEEVTPFTAGKRSLANWLVTTAGGQHIFEDLDAVYDYASWEAVIERDPEIIVILDYGTPTGEEKKTFLLNESRLASITAVQNQNIVIVPFEYMNTGVRVGMAVELLAKAFHPEVFQ
jgi:iron complex transport system substrate-binding protein